MQAFPSSRPSFFVAGVMQGSRAGAELADQGYRPRLTAVIRERFPDADVIDPGVVMWQELRVPRHELGQAHARLLERPEVLQASFEAPVRELVRVFHHLTDLAAAADVCVAWLPEHEASMGTAAEMYAAHRAGRAVVAITPMRQNLAVLACTTAIVPDIEAFARWLDTHGQAAVLAGGEAATSAMEVGS